MATNLAHQKPTSRDCNKIVMRGEHSHSSIKQPSGEQHIHTPAVHVQNAKVASGSAASDVRAHRAAAAQRRWWW